MLGHSSSCRDICSWKVQNLFFPLADYFSWVCPFFLGLWKWSYFWTASFRNPTQITPHLCHSNFEAGPHYRPSIFQGKMSTDSRPLLFSLVTSGSFLFWNSNKYNVNINKKALIQVTHFQWCEHKYSLVHLLNRDLSQRIHVLDRKSQRISSKHLK